MDSIDLQLQAQVKSAQLYRPIKFLPAHTKAARFVPGNSRFKPINPRPEDTEGADGSDDEPEKPVASVARTQGSTASAFSASDGSRTLATTWEHIVPIGSGLQNLGNTCYLNSALQCLLHTPPLANLLLFHSDKFHDECPNKKGQLKFCFLCELRNQCVRSFGGPFSSSGAKAKSADGASGRSGLRAIVHGGLPLLGKHFKVGRQMDSQEFLMLLLEHLEKASLSHKSVRAAFQGWDVPPVASDPDPSARRAPKPTSMVFATFGGYLQSQIRCLQCPYESNTYDPCMGLPLELTNASTLEQALKHFTEPEVLEKENAYKCPKCKRPVPARKQFTVYRTPAILSVQLKRFTWTGSKISKKISYPLELDLSPYMTENNILSTEQAKEVIKAKSKMMSKEQRSDLLRGSKQAKKKIPLCQYELYGVLVHLGGGCRSGHYICYAKSAAGIWHRMDDEYVQKVSQNEVLAQKDAYLLFYQRKGEPSTENMSALVSSVAAAAKIPKSPAISNTTPIAKGKTAAPKLDDSDDSSDSSESSSSESLPTPPPSKIPKLASESKVSKPTVSGIVGTPAINAKPVVMSSAALAAQKKGVTATATMLVTGKPIASAAIPVRDKDEQELDQILSWGDKKLKGAASSEVPSKTENKDTNGASRTKRKREDSALENGAPAAKKGKANNVLSHLLSSSMISTPLIAKVGSWADENGSESSLPQAAGKAQRSTLLKMEEDFVDQNAKGIKKRQRDEYDVEYEKGKLPKRRKKSDEDEVAVSAQRSQQFQKTAEIHHQRKQREIAKGTKGPKKGAAFASPSDKFRRTHRKSLKERRNWRNL